MFRRALFADHNLFWFRRWLRFIGATANQKLFLCRRRSVFLIPTRAPFGLHFGVILEAVGSFFGRAKRIERRAKRIWRRAKRIGSRTFEKVTSRILLGPHFWTVFGPGPPKSAKKCGFSVI